MAFHTADYDVYVVLGDPDAQPLWNWTAWQRFSPALDSLIRAARGKPALRTTQYLPDRAGTVKFGRLGWKDANHQKWAHGSPVNKKTSKSWSFLDLELWAPAWTACEREDRAPDVFLCIFDESLGGGWRKKLLFNPVIVFAVLSELARREPAIVAAVVAALRNVTSAKLLGFKRRPWGKPLGTIGFTDSIQHLAVSGLFKPGPRHEGKIGIHLLAERWQPVAPE